ncbi:CaiB/BaiF CoA transferase family protein [uncultured Jatrophihabitans sp.]|uniref:CaiB/BaiF CoA transferase family protein n=1 Tax=uncultured Jatrophihabitans sp. TaxID=1610747 RepID=UPI0035CA6712
MTESPQDAPRPTGPLDGVVVVDLGQIYNAPYATLLLALAGAQVIKVEPIAGEISRTRRLVNLGAGIAFYMLNSNKQCVTLNLKDPRGQRLLTELTDRADVVVENFRPGVMKRLGVGPEVLRARNPRLIYASGSGYGQTGVYRDLPAMDLTVQAMTGVVASTGFPEETPLKSGPALSDFLGGIHLYGAITTALYRQARTGEGAVLDVAMIDSVLPALMSNIGPFVAAGIEGRTPPPERTGNRQGGLAESPYNIYPTKDGHLALVCITEQHWLGLVAVMDRPELLTDPRYATKLGRIAAMDDVDALVADWTRTQDTEQAFAGLRAAGVVCAPVRSLGDVIADPYFRARGMIRDVEVETIGTLPLMHSPLHFADSARIPLESARGLGADNEAVYGGLPGYSSDLLETYRAEGVI